MFLPAWALAHPLLIAFDRIAVNKKTIILAAALIFVLAGSGAGIWFFVPDLIPEFIRPKAEGHGKDDKTKAEKRHEPEVSADLDTFVVNLAGREQGRYLRMTLSLGVRSGKEKEEVKEFVAPIRHTVIMFLSLQKAEDLLEPNGKVKLQAELLKQINAVIGKKMVQNIYFKEFLIQ